LVIRVPVPVSPDISQTMAPSRLLERSQLVLCWIDQVSSNDHRWPPFPVKQ
jgi:hypothetical protein